MNNNDTVMYWTGIGSTYGRRTFTVISSNKLSFSPTKKKTRVRPERYRKLLKWVATLRWERFFFCRKTGLGRAIEQPLRGSYLVKNFLCKSFIVQQRQNPKFDMVWAGICATSKTPFNFIDLCVKLNKHLYWKVFLKNAAVPQDQKHYI